LRATVRIAMLLLPLAAAASGCATLHANPAADFADAPAMEDPGVEPAPRAATLSLEVRAAGKQPEIRQIPLQGVTHVQDVLEQTNLTRRFRRMKVHVVRTIGDRMAKLDANYEHQAGRIDPLYDYALHPGDHLVVVEDTSTVLDDMLNNLPNPLGPPRGR
jgi:hypothetical protein